MIYVPVLSYKGILMSLKLAVLPFGTLFPAVNSADFSVFSSRHFRRCKFITLSAHFCLQHSSRLVGLQQLGPVLHRLTLHGCARRECPCGFCVLIFSIVMLTPNEPLEAMWAWIKAADDWRFNVWAVLQNPSHMVLCGLRIAPDTERVRIGQIRLEVARRT